MNKVGEFAVIGLGRFGHALVRSLVQQEQSLLAIDRDPARVEAIAEFVDAAVCADTTDEEALAGLHLDRMSCVVVAIGSKATEASILTTALLHQVGIPRIVARAFSHLHARVLLAVGAHEVLNPEEEIARRLASRLAQPSVGDQIELGEANIAEVDLPSDFAGQTLQQLDLRRRYGVNVLAVKRDDKVRGNPPASELLESGDILVVMGTASELQRLGALV